MSPLKLAAFLTVLVFMCQALILAIDLTFNDGEDQ